MSAQSRRRALRAAAPVAGLLAAGLLVWQGSYAAFSASTDNTNNSWAAGQLTLDNSVNGGAGFSGTTTGVFSQTALKPGDTGSRCITVRSNGDLPGTAKLFLKNESTTNAFDASLTITVEQKTGVSANAVAADCSGFGTTGITTIVAAQHLSTAAAAYTSWASGAGSWTTTNASPEYAAYRITWSVDTGAPSSVMGGTAKTDFVWEVQN